MNMDEIIFEVCEDETDGGFVARALGQSIVTQAETWDGLRANVREAVLCHFDEGHAPRVIRIHRVMDEVLAAVLERLNL
jgi:predicted RNase H-like HicB family nuclease